MFFFFFQAEDGIRDKLVTGVQTCALPISVYDQYVEAVETGTFEALEAYARNLSERIIPRGVETHEVVGIVLLLRDVLARSLFAKYRADFTELNRVQDAYEPAANRIANTVAVGFVQEARADHPPATRSDPRALDSGPARARATADPSDHRHHRPAACSSAHRATAPWHPGQPLQGRRDRHHWGPGHGRQCGEPSGPNRGGLAALGRHGHRDRVVSRDCPDPGQHRSRPGQDEHRWRPAGRHRGG